MKSKFDKLFENVMDDELDVNLDLGPGAGPEDSSAEDMDMDLGAESETGSEDITLTLDRETAQKLHDMLGDVLGGGEELSGEEDSDLEDLEIDTDSDSDSEDEDENEKVEEEDEEEDEESYKEAIESEKLPDSKGHSLTKAGTVGNIKASSKKASSDITDEVGSSTLGDKSNVLQKPGTVGNLGKGQDFFKA
jgi:hypothetical protein